MKFCDFLFTWFELPSKSYQNDAPRKEFPSMWGKYTRRRSQLLMRRTIICIFDGPAIYKERGHNCDVMMDAIASQITSVSMVCSTVYSGTSKKTSKRRITGHCEGISPVTGEIPSQMASNVKNISI